jgi:4-diphosphocytidyl-2-C-methyl-D-erythritol kinase
MSVRVFAPAKINLTLQVGPPGADGRHPLQSVVSFADVGDWVEAAPGDGLSLEVIGPFAAALRDEPDNLALRAARALAQTAGVRADAALTLEKHLPIASGIGGGSADAAACLKALNRLWGVRASDADLAAIARPLGADVPACVLGRSLYMTGAGEDAEPLEVPPLDAVLINPLQPLATARVYQRFDALGLGGEFTTAPAPLWPDPAAAVAAIAALGNDLTAPAADLAPVIAAMLALLRADPRARVAALSGSGASVFAITDDAEAARALAADVARAEWWVRPTVLGA